MLTATEIEKLMIVEALELFEFMFTDFFTPGSEDLLDFEKKFGGLPMDVIFYIYKGILSEWRLGLESKVSATPLSTVIERIAAKVLESGPIASLPAPQTESVTAQETQSVTRAVTFRRSTPRSTKDIVDNIFTGERPTAQQFDLIELRRKLDAGEFLQSAERVALQRKRCTKCQKIQPFDGFARSNAAADGKQSWCKDCTNSSPANQRKLKQIPAEVLESPAEREEEEDEDAAGSSHRVFNPATNELETEAELHDDAEGDYTDPPEMDEDFDNPDPVKPLRAKEIPPPDMTVKFIYSRQVRCPKCGAGMVRLMRGATSDPKKDYWLHLRTGQNAPCQIKISHYNIKDDMKYKGKL